MIRFALLLGTLLLGACASSLPEPNYYLLRSDTDSVSRQLQPAPHFALGRVSIAPYIDQPGLLLETSEGDLRAARYHLWAEPLAQGARSLLVSAISEARGEDILLWEVHNKATRFDIRIDQLHGTHNGQAKLVAHWWIYDGNDVERAYQFAKTSDLQQDGYGELAAAEKSLLIALAKKVAETLVKTP